MSLSILNQLTTAQTQIANARAQLLEMPHELLVDLCISLAAAHAPTAETKLPLTVPIAPEAARATVPPSSPSPTLAPAAEGETIAALAERVLSTSPGLTVQQLRDTLHSMGRTTTTKIVYHCLTKKPALFVGKSSPAHGRAVVWSLRTRRG